MPTLNLDLDILLLDYASLVSTPGCIVIKPIGMFNSIRHRENYVHYSDVNSTRSR